MKTKFLGGNLARADPIVYGLLLHAEEPCRFHNIKIRIPLPHGLEIPEQFGMPVQFILHYSQLIHNCMECIHMVLLTHSFPML